MTIIQQRISAVTNYTLQYFQQWHPAAAGAFEIAAARLMLVAGRGPARVHSCEKTLRHIHVADKVRAKSVASALLLRALALLKSGELRTLCVTSPGILEFILQQQERVVESPLFISVRTVDWSVSATHPNAAFALLERYAANITELNCPLQTR
jgi:hypothetical protein